MKPLTFMLVAGDPSGDALAAQLVARLRERVLAGAEALGTDAQPLRTALAPRFIGAGGPKMAATGVPLAFDLTRHALIGISEVIKNYGQIRRRFHDLLALAIAEQPEVIIGVDYGGLNLRLGQAINRHLQKHRSEFVPWNPKLIQFVSPQVWASRPARAYVLAAHYDLLLSIFPFEQPWYAHRVPQLPVQFVGHPLLDRIPPPWTETPVPSNPRVVFLPGSRNDEVRRHGPVLCGAFELLRRELPGLRGKMILPTAALEAVVRERAGAAGLEVQVGGLTEALTEADLAITKSGTVTMECAFHGVPAIVFYKTSWPTYWIARQIISVKYVAMPNLLAGEEIFPEFIQSAATPAHLAVAAAQLLRDSARRTRVQEKLRAVIGCLGGAGAADRAAAAILRLLP